MNNLHDALLSASRSENILNQDVIYLAKKYIDDDTTLDLPMIFDDIDPPNITYNDLNMRVYNKIQSLKPGTRIDTVKLFTYIDYYFECVQHIFKT